MNVVYIGISRGTVKTGVRGRINNHKSRKVFTHFFRI